MELAFIQRYRGASRAALALSAFSLPFYGAGDFVPTVFGLPLNLLIPVAASPLFVVSIARSRKRLPRNPLFSGVLLLALAQLLAAAFSPVKASLSEWGAPLLMVVLIAALAAETADPAFRRTVLRWGIFGGLSAMAISLAGAALTALFGDPAMGHAFYFSGSHAVLSGLPRLTGTFSHYPQAFGEYLVFLMALLFAARANPESPADAPVTPRVRTAGLVLSALCLFLTFSYAWVGGFLLWGLAWQHSKPGRRSVQIVPPVLLVTLAFGWLMNLGPPLSTKERGLVERDCRLSDTYTTVTWARLDADLKLRDCRQYVDARPYPHLRRTYGESKRAALAAFLKRPLFGFGHAGYDDFSRRRLEAIHPGPWIMRYRDPHGIFHGIPALYGLPGLAALILLGLGFRRVFRNHMTWTENRAEPWFLFGILAFSLIGLNLWVLRSRALWFLFGLALGERGESSEDQAETHARNI